MLVTASRLVEQPMDMSPHVVLVGAGASRAAFPNGEGGGKKLPVMSDLVEVVGLASLLGEVGLNGSTNFESIYSSVSSSPDYRELTAILEAKVRTYFGSLALPKIATHYDRLLLSLRGKDAVFTFNWDPFLFDAYGRNLSVARLPRIFFLHGNVRIGACPQHGDWGEKGYFCPQCSAPYTDVPLLYPIEKKNYSSDPYIAGAWKAAGILFGEAFTLTIFGYGAPVSDADAVQLLRGAWYTDGTREVEHVEVIDTAEVDELHERWKPFTPTLHLHIRTRFEGSLLWRWPRRSCESLFYPMTKGWICEDFPLPEGDSLVALQSYAARIASQE